MKRRHLWALLLLLAFGAARMPYEQQLAAERKAAFFHGAKFDLALNAQLGQMAFLAALSGFRTPIADGFYLYANTAYWERVEWGRMKINFDIATSLQPRCVLFWEQAAWHMAFNASISVFQDKNQPREALRIKAQKEYWDLGEDYFLRGIANNPDNANLLVLLGNLYRDKYVDHCKAADAYGRAAVAPNAPSYVHRFAAYELAQCPGHEKEAYDKLREFYLRGEDEHLPTLLKTLRLLQEKLDIPPEQKIAIPAASNP